MYPFILKNFNFFKKLLFLQYYFVPKEAPVSRALPKELTMSYQGSSSSGCENGPEVKPIPATEGWYKYVVHCVLLTFLHSGPGYLQSLACPCFFVYFLLEIESPT